MHPTLDTTKLRMFAVYCALGYVIMIFGGLLVAGFLPPPSPEASAAKISALFAGNELKIRFGMLLIMWSVLIFIPFAAVCSYYIARVEGGYGVLSLTVLLGGVGNMVLSFYPGIWWMAAAFRPDRLQDAVYLLNDACWTQLIGGISMYDAMPICVAITAFMDKSPNPIFPRWCGFMNIFLVLAFMPDQALFFFHSGPFAWNGLFSFWIPVSAFAGWFVIQFVVLRQAVLHDKAVQYAAAPAGLPQFSR